MGSLRDQIGHAIIGVIFLYILEIPNDSYIPLRQILIGLSLRSEMSPYRDWLKLVIEMKATLDCLMPYLIFN